MYKWLLVLSAALAAAGCGQDEKSTAPQRQEKVLTDPFHYSPFDKNPDVSGGGIGEFRKEAFKKDVDNVINP
jgi:hypothetical protein